MKGCKQRGMRGSRVLGLPARRGVGLLGALPARWSQCSPTPCSLCSRRVYLQDLWLKLDYLLKNGKVHKDHASTGAATPGAALIPTLPPGLPHRGCPHPLQPPWVAVPMLGTSPDAGHCLVAAGAATCLC